MSNNSKLKLSMKLESENGMTSGEGDSAACRGTFSSKTTGSSRYDDYGYEGRIINKRSRDDRGRGVGRGHYRGRGSYEISSTRIFVESKSQDSTKSVDVYNKRSEDCKISKLLRKLSRENDSEKFMALSKMLQTAIVLPENTSYLRHNMELITESLLDLLHSAPSSHAKNEAAVCLGCVGYALHSEFPRFLVWLCGRFMKERSVRVLLMKALLETIQMDSQQPVLAEYASAFMSEMKTVLDLVDLPEVLIACVDVLLAGIQLYPESFNLYFKDTVDILVGWALSFQEASSLNFALRSLHQLKPYWLCDVPFALSLLTQFLEDAAGYLEDLQSTQSGVSEADAGEVTPQEVLTLLRLFNTVSSCLVVVPGVAVTSPESPAVLSSMGAQGLSISKYLIVISKALKLCPSSALVTAANIGIASLLAQFQDLTAVAILSVLEYISSLMALLPNLDEGAILSTIQLISKVVVDLGSRLPSDLASSLLGLGAPLAVFKLSPHPEIVENLIQLYRAFLQQPLQFQGVIWLIKEDTDPAVAVLTSPDSEINLETLEAAVHMLMFHVQTIGQAALSGEAVLRILDLLLQWRPESPLLAARCPSLHHAILVLTHAYCAKFQNFVSTSMFVTSESTYHFATIVMIISSLLSERILPESVLLLLGWARELLLACQPFLAVLLQLDYFQNLISAITSVANTIFDDSIVLLVGSCLTLLVGYFNHFHNAEVIRNIIGLCCHLTNSMNNEVAALYSNLFSSIPLDKTLTLVVYDSEALTKSRSALLRSHVTRGSPGLLSSRNFKCFMDYVLSGENNGDNKWLEELFLESYPLGLQIESNSASKLKQMALNCRGVVLPWACFEAAQTCVLNKLRTSLGKPPETFTAFEAALKACAKDTRGSDNGLACLDTITRSRVLLDFMEWLEKVGPPKFALGIRNGYTPPKLLEVGIKYAVVLETIVIYNASEGLAVTLPPPPKNVRAFFLANKATCANWLTRIRLVMGIVGVACGQSAATVRNCHALLAQLVHARNTQGSEFESAVLYCACALLSLREPEAITGLYVWCQKEADRSFPWLVPLAHHAANRFELAVEGYQNILEAGQKSLIGKTDETLSDHSSQSEGSPVKIARPVIDGSASRFVYDCLLDCYRRTDDFYNLSLWLEKKQNFIRDTKNGTTIDKFLDPPWSKEDIDFLKNAQELLINRSSKYHWKIRPVDLIEEPSESIKALDQSILDARISLITDNDINEGCKRALTQLSDWSQTTNMDIPTHWRVENVTESLKQSLITDAVFIHVGTSLESKSFVLQMSENNKIEIDLNVNQLLEQWGATYDFELSNILKEIKEGYIKGKENFVNRVQSKGSALESLLKEHLRDGRSSTSRNLIILDAVCRDLLNGSRTFQDLNIPSNGHRFPSDLLLHLAFWKRLLGEDDLKLHVLKAARKEGNLKLAKRCLLWHFKGNHNEDKDIVDVCDELVENFDRNMTSVEGELSVQVAKLLYCCGANASAMDFGSLTALKLIRPDNSEDVRQSGSRMLLTLAKWLQRMPGNITPQAVHNLIQIPDGALDDLLAMPCDTVNDQRIIPEHEMAIGRVLSMSVAHCSSLAKTWSQYASWCYRWGRKMVDAAAKADMPLSELDVVRIKQTIPDTISESELQQIFNILSHTRSSPEEDIQNESLSTIEAIQGQLLSIPSLSGASQEVLSTLINIWRDSQGRASSAYCKAAQAYFKYLHLCSDKQNSDPRTLTATLRILRLLVKHAVELQSLLEQELPTTPPQPWQGIIPQLFSRLNHPEAYVRARLAELLCRIAQTAPNLIIFPAVVGSSAGANRIADINNSTSKLLATCMSQNSDEDGDDVEEEEPEEDEYENVAADSQCSTLINCYKAIVDTLSKQMPDAISEVQRFVSELRRITLLWDELWLGTLNQHHGEVTRRIYQLEQEVRKVDNNPSLSAEEKPALIAEKHRILMKPVVFILEQLQSITSVAPETPHEVWFQEKLGDAINVALDKLRNPADPRDPAASWHSFRAIHSKLQKRAQKRACTVLKMENISPVLFGMKNTAIPMPGLCGPSLVTISSISNAVLVLPTKTKPKKLDFKSNKGTTHTYLFKGLEDLHLDERIMQFLAIANTMLGNNGSNEYRARHYSVTPLGPRSGLISWVDGVIPLFTLYKKWQQRDNAAKQPSDAHCAQVALRPSEMFYNKLTPLLKEAGVSVERRKEWPLPLLKQVLQELMTETPSDLLAKELWCNSLHVEEWWATTKRYSRSVAVMSVIGYIIGLGDRHLDNVLIDLHSGEMVHIDYNVCFEKGKTLRVPEKVPFRMTQNIREALGVTGVEGQFQLACEHVLKVLKCGRDTLLPLLEAFVYDPLIDWTPGSETGYTGAVYGGGEAVKETRQSRKALEREVTRAMFVVRITEMKAEWYDNREKVLLMIPEVSGKLEQFLSVSREAQAVEESLADAHQQMLVIKEAEATGAHHPLYSLASRCSLLLKARVAHAALSQVLRERRDDYEREITHYQDALRELCGEGISKWMKHLSTPAQPDSFLTFDLVKQFLQTAGQASMVTQCDQAETEMGQMDTKQRQLMRTCADLLAEYGELKGLYPSQMRLHRATKYKQWCERLLSNLSAQECASVLAELKSTFGENRSSLGALAKQAATFSATLQTAVTSAQTKLKRAIDVSKQDGGLAEVHDSAFVEARTRLTDMAKSDAKSAVAVQLIIISALCRLNQAFLKMETVAKNTEGGLEAMRLKDGHSWLEEMCIVSGLISEMAGILSTYTTLEGPIKAAFATLHKTHSIFSELLELHVNFHSIILPEALKCATTEHPDMLSMMADLRATVAESGIPLDELQKQLKLHLRSIIMDMKSQHSDVQNRVARLRAGLESLLQKPCLDAGQSPGQMLLMGFHGMFEKLAVEGRQMISLLTQLTTVPAWHKLDQMKEASTLTALALDGRARSTTDDMFLVRRVQTMQEFFGLCETAGAAFRGSSAPVVLDDDRLNRPIRRFAAEFVVRIMLGATSQSLVVAICYLLQQLNFNLSSEIEGRDIGSDGRVSLDEVCRRALEVCLQKGMTSNTLISHAMALVGTIQTRYRDRERCKLLQEAVEMRERSLTRLQALLTAHSWHHEDALQEIGAVAPALHNRSSFMTKLRKASTALLSLQTRMAEARESQRSLVASVEQRLRWAGGVNPALVEVLAAFESGIVALDRRLDQDASLAAHLGALCMDVLRHEALRTRTSEALIQDEAMLKIIEQCNDIVNWRAGCCEKLTPVEEGLLLLMTPESSADPNNLKNLEMKISDNIEQLKVKRGEFIEKLIAVKIDCETEIEKLKTLLGNHHALMTEVRNPLKSMAKFEEMGGAGIAEYLDKYRYFSESMGNVVGLLAPDKPLSVADVQLALTTLEEMPQLIATIYDDLVGFADKSKLDAKKRPPLLRQESVYGSPKHLPGHDVMLRPAKGFQERNAYALNVWRRIQMKLEGRDPDPGRRLSPNEQVEYIIREATSLDNLALLYEGWTPWV